MLNHASKPSTAQGPYMSGNREGQSEKQEIGWQKQEAGVIQESVRSRGMQVNSKGSEKKRKQSLLGA